jgi:hypothetical protein
LRCPWCDFDAAIREVHAHLADVHLERVELQERGDRRYYRIACPSCEAAHEQEVKPRYRDAAFLEEYRREIALVGFDMLINHLMAEHGAT